MLKDSNQMLCGWGVAEMQRPILMEIFDDSAYKKLAAFMTMRSYDLRRGSCGIRDAEDA